MMAEGERAPTQASPAVLDRSGLIFPTRPSVLLKARSQRNNRHPNFDRSAPTAVVYGHAALQCLGPEDTRSLPSHAGAPQKNLLPPWSISAPHPLQHYSK